MTAVILVFGVQAVVDYASTSVRKVEPMTPKSTQLFYNSLGSAKICRRWHVAIKYGKVSPEAARFAVRRLDKVIAKIDAILDMLT